MPKDFNQIPSSAPKDKQMAAVRITPERLLHEQGQTIEALAHVRVPRREPHPHAGRNRDHRRPATIPSTATTVARSTGPAIRTRPPAHSTSTTPPRLSSGGRGVSAGAGSTSGTKAGAGGGSADCSGSRSSRRHRNSKLGVIPYRRATAEIESLARCASSTMARFSQTAQDRRVLATTVCEKAFGPDIGTIQVPPTDLYRSHPNPGLTRRHWPGAYGGAGGARASAGRWLAQAGDADAGPGQGRACPPVPRYPGFPPRARNPQENRPCSWYRPARERRRRMTSGSNPRPPPSRSRKRRDQTRTAGAAAPRKLETRVIVTRVSSPGGVRAV